MMLYEWIFCHAARAVFIACALFSIVYGYVFEQS